MTTIAQAAYMASNNNADYWLHQVNRDLPYGDIDAMALAAKDEGLCVTQKTSNMFLVNNMAWVMAHGNVRPI